MVQSGLAMKPQSVPGHAVGRLTWSMWRRSRVQKSKESRGSQKFLTFVSRGEGLHSQEDAPFPLADFPFLITTSEVKKEPVTSRPASSAFQFRRASLEQCFWSLVVASGHFFGLLKGVSGEKGDRSLRMEGCWRSMSVKKSSG